jgi:hypothetical protein
MLKGYLLTNITDPGFCAAVIRERKRGAAPLDFDRIGTEFHRWVRWSLRVGFEATP